MKRLRMFRVLVKVYCAIGDFHGKAVSLLCRHLVLHLATNKDFALQLAVLQFAKRKKSHIIMAVVA